MKPLPVKALAPINMAGCLGFASWMAKISIVIWLRAVMLGPLSSIRKGMSGKNSKPARPKLAFGRARPNQPGSSDIRVGNSLRPQRRKAALSRATFPGMAGSTTCPGSPGMATSRLMKRAANAGSAQRPKRVTLAGGPLRRTDIHKDLTDRSSFS